jgi:diketogulonate reductase-like aldo/keto reductase
MILREIPSTKEMLPVIGLGTWQTFDITPSGNHESLKEVLNTVKNAAGKLIDSSPMYGRSEEVVGLLTSQLPSSQFFYATKVWTKGREEGIRQMESSFRKFRQPVIDLMQIHNLVDWKTHIQTLRKWKEEGRIKYIGITHYMGSMHEEMVKIIKTEEIDFVQFNYSIDDGHAEKYLLPAAKDHGVATLVNRPFGEGRLFNKVGAKALPSWLNEYRIESWSQFFLKFIISHPAVTCVIPATSNPAHAADNMQAGLDPLPDESTRAKMIAVMKSF